MYPFPLVAGYGSLRRRVLQTAENDSDTARCDSVATAPRTAKEQLYDSYIKGDFMFSTTLMSYDDMLRQVDDGWDRAAAKPAADVRKQQLSQPQTKCADDQSSVENAMSKRLDGWGSHENRSIAAAGTAAVEQQPTRQGVPPVRSESSDSDTRKSMTRDSGSHHGVSVQWQQNGAVANVPVQKKVFLWPFRRSSAVSEVHISSLCTIPEFLYVGRNGTSKCHCSSRFN